jgi:hypothetical protein
MEGHDPDSWYEIHEWIPPENAFANVGVWAPVCIRDCGGLRVWREENAEDAESQFKTVDSKRRFRLALVSRRIIEDRPARLPAVIDHAVQQGDLP